MAVISTSAANEMVTTIVDLLDSAGAGTSGTLEIQTAGGVLLAELGLSNPAFVNPSVAGVATADTIADETSAVSTGTAAQFELKSNTGEVVISGTVGAGSGDISLNTTSINVGDSLSITSLTVTMPTGA